MPSDPRLSVIVPVYNDPDGLRDTLDSLVDQKRSPRYEVIVVDNNSTDETPKVIEEFKEKYPDLVIGCSERDIQSSYAARNTGIEHASGEILAFIDADVTVENTWATDVCERFKKTDVDYLGCNVEMYIPEGENTFWARYDAAMGLPVEYYLETKYFAPTCALAVRREVIREIGDFDESLISGGDKEFGNRVNDDGFKMEYDSEIIVQHPVRSSLQEHLNKAIRIGKGQAQLANRYKLSSKPYSLLRFLPPSPARIQERTQTKGKIIPIYLAAYLLKLVQTISSLQWWYVDGSY